jgi:transcriptional regulator with XRE-family HTH domain
MATETHAAHPQPFGRRISERRVTAGLTQQQLSVRIAMSRAALSHLEGGITVASERTVCLLAGVFDLEPHELVAGTDYPIAKAERLPLFVARHSRVDLALALLNNDLAWCARLDDKTLTTTIVDDWLGQLTELSEHIHDPGERTRLRHARATLLQPWSAHRTIR